MKAKSIFDQISPEHLGLLKRSYMLYGQTIPLFGGNSDDSHARLGNILLTHYVTIRENIINYNYGGKFETHKFTNEFIEYLQEKC